ncbi:MAG: excisionase family DNA-binding protein [Bifidobacteriaceae bacterium]|nr:excisionase family DNA-binding protein [Bifidobacteriaceae bacterium]
MPIIETIATSRILPDQIQALEQFAAASPSQELADVLQRLIHCIRQGDELTIIDGSADVTPNQAAAQLGMSRSHLYKLLDRGEIAFHRVGRDRRIRLRDLLEFEGRRQGDRRELAERFAHQRENRDHVVEELAELL